MLKIFKPYFKAQLKKTKGNVKGSCDSELIRNNTVVNLKKKNDQEN